MSIQQKPGVAIILASALLVACGPEEQAPQTGRTASVEPAASAPAFDPEAAEALMNQPLDGGSVAAFESGLAKLKATVKPEDYQKVKTSLEWKQFYDLSIGGDKAKLYASFDGATPREIIEQAGQRSGQ